MKKIFPYSFVLGTLFVTWILWFLSKEPGGFSGIGFLRCVSQFFALTGITLMSVVLFYSSRLKVLEKIWGGLDKMYLKHHFFGLIAFIFLLVHPLLLAFNSLKEPFLVRVYVFPSTSSLVSYNLGILALYTMIFAFIFIIFIKTSYHVWKFTHRFLALAMLFAGLHVFLISSDVAVFMPLRYWVLFWAAVGISSGIYKIFFYGRFGPKFVYKLEKVEAGDKLLSLFLKSIGKKIHFNPGQFAFLSFKDGSVGEEQHPFSFASLPEDKNLRFLIKSEGDFTGRLIKSLKNDGTPIEIFGPYGNFGSVLKRESEFIWIAGGIGVAPFLSMLSANILDNKKIWFFFSFKEEEESKIAKEIQKKVGKYKNVYFNPWDSNKKGRINADKIIGQINGGVNKTILLCGPLSMMKSLTGQFIKKGFCKERIVYEKFSL